MSTDGLLQVLQRKAQKHAFSCPFVMLNCQSLSFVMCSHTTAPNNQVKLGQERRVSKVLRYEMS